MIAGIRPSPARTISVNLLLGAVIIVWLSPMSWLIMTSVDPEASGSFSVPSRISLEHFAVVLSGTSLRQFINSLVIALATAMLTTAVACMAAYPFSRLKIPYKDTLLWSLALLRILPSTAIIIPVFLTGRVLGLLNAGGVVLILTLMNLPFAILLLKNFFDTIPTELEEAAYIEGATLTQNLLHVVFPLSRAGLAVIWFMAFTSAWNEFLFPFVMLRSDQEFPMAVGLYAAFGQYGTTDYGFLTAYSIIYAAPAVLVYFLLKRNLTTGFAGVGVKG
ncbi:carbohydrate ABC transporter permease [Mesorhizobium sp. Z1-4]|uniref:carbohydrate ABC transporter permease n=1 Tax=Mesorhizobium sp. Z1-4 TaxID=2448478 RepID=UPI000FD88247|nr:carbohydrate ABC transporter permease [Mesorhizobium sp. Z1-4]